MDLVSILATVILVTTIGTTVVGVGAYAAFKLRDKRRPKAKKSTTGPGHEEPVFLKRYLPPAEPAKAE
ncbi:hypothetical protein [Noviherbaspirillum galbum]|uniref:Uncharacterized protein n=1 Tax=Noviherbaspirillum galbum TaxID=2709383 RepID=A0A6B3SKY0_9BURK|nr:hypothetical protein [Noviherbaspirillum galbum]NEX60015.1 hypothetical protein [Noviherbaspirillum galbum]